VTLTSHLPSGAADTETFTDDMTTLCGDVTVQTDGTATCTTSALPLGTDVVTARPPVASDPYAATTEVLAIDVTAAGTTEPPTPTPTGATAPVPTTGAGSPGSPLPALLLVLAGGIGIAASWRLRRVF
jgi:hypothetical protein